MGALRQLCRRGGRPARCGIGGWRGYEWWEAKKAAETGAAFEAAITLAEAGKRSEAEAAFAKIAADGTSGYRHLARLREAAELAQTDAKAAIAAYDKIAADGAVGPVLQDLAAVARRRAPDRCRRVRRGAPAARAAGRSRSHVPPHRTRIAGARRLARRRYGGGQALVDMIMTDAQTPAATRSRVEMLMALGAAEGKS